MAESCMLWRRSTKKLTLEPGRMEGWTDIDTVFMRYSSEGDEGERRMSLFQVKCTLLSLFGIGVPTVDIKKHLENLDPEWRITGVTKIIFTRLAAEYNTRSEHEIIHEAYKKFDKMNKGFISSTEFMNVVGEVLPHLTPSTVEGIFRAADVYRVHKVTFPQFKVLAQADVEDLDMGE